MNKNSSIYQKYCFPILNFLKLYGHFSSHYPVMSNQSILSKVLNSYRYSKHAYSQTISDMTTSYVGHTRGSQSHGIVVLSIHQPGHAILATQSAVTSRRQVVSHHCLLDDFTHRLRIFASFLKRE